MADDEVAVTDPLITQAKAIIAAAEESNSQGELEIWSGQEYVEGPSHIFDLFDIVALLTALVERTQALKKAEAFLDEADRHTMLSARAVAALATIRSVLQGGDRD